MEKNSSREKPRIIFEDNHLLVLNKPAGVLVQGDETGDSTLLDWGKNYLKEKYAKPGEVYLGLAHRIDRPVSGAVICARTSKALPRLNLLFSERKVKKKYLAIVLKRPLQDKGVLKHFLDKNPNTNTVKAYPETREGAKEAILEYKLLFSLENGQALLEVNPITGRAHQIRAQLSAIGCPILGDLKYGAPTPLPDASIGLHCLSMELEHPVRKEPLLVEADLPNKPWWKSVNLT